MVHRALVVTLALSIWVSVGVSASARPQTGNVIRGKVRNESGGTLRHVVVMLNVGVGGMVNQTVTNEEGDFVFSGLTGTSYTISISQPGFVSYTESVTFSRPVDEGQPAEIKSVFVTLEAEPRARILAPRVRFVQQVPVLARTAYERGVAHSRDKRAQDAIAAYEEAIGAFDRYFDAHFALGCELLMTSRVEAAIRSFDAANRINPADERVYACFGEALSQQKKFAVAAAAYGQAARIRPDEAHYPFMRAIALIDQARALGRSQADWAGLLTAAESDLDRAYELSRSELSAVRLQRARIHEARGDLRRAAGELESYLRENPNAENAAAIRKAIEKLRAKG